MRSAALRLWAKLLERFPEDLDSSAFWAAWSCAVEPVTRKLTVEVGVGSLLHHDGGRSLLPNLNPTCL